MKTKFLLFLVLVLILVSPSVLFSQEVYKWFQDGKVVLQVKESNNVHFELKRNGEIEIDKVVFLRKIASKYSIQSLRSLHPNHADSKLARTYEITFDDVTKVDALIRELSTNDLFAYVEKKELHVSTYTPNDTYYVNSTTAGQWHLFQIKAAEAWDIFQGDPNTVIAVTDNAINIDHPDLKNNVVQGYDAVDQDNDPRGCGSNTGFHGSHVSGIVGAQTDNGSGIASIGFNCKVMPIKIGNCQGQLTGGYEGIVWAADRNADVINASWGGGGASTYGQNVCNYAWNKGSILIVASGNNNSSTQFYPAAYNYAVSVASTRSGDVKSSFSNYGSWIDISAPGSDILSCNSGTGYSFTQGTSMASPLVAGLVGLMRSYAPNASQQDILNCLYSSCKNINAQNPSYVGSLGAGRIDAFAALQCLAAYAKTLDVGVESILSPNENVCGASITPEIQIKNYGSSTVTQLTITYSVVGGTPQSYTWTGNLVSGQTTDITLPNIGGINQGNNSITVTLSNPNGQQDQYAANDSKSLPFSVVIGGDEVVFTLNLDCFGNDNIWTIKDQSGASVMTGGPYVNNASGETKVYSICLAPGCYTFEMTDSYGDGLYGSQHVGECTINGDYNLKDSQGNTLFAMSANNGAFGSSVTHDFCVVNSSIGDDVGIDKIEDPNLYVCGTTQITPTIIIRNYGANTLTSATINYRINGGAIEQFNWSGNLTSGTTQSVTLNSIAGVEGINDILVFTTLPNGQADQNQMNDSKSTKVIASLNGKALPFTEDFENNIGDWFVDNDDNDVTWSIENVAGNGGDKAAGIDFFSYSQQARRDGLLSSPIDFTGQTVVSMDFEHAYRRFDQNSTDSLIIYVSKDCGKTFERVFARGEDGTGTLATATTSTVVFDPRVSDDWCLSGVGSSCYTIDLTAYAGMSNVIVKFEAFNAGTTGNNLFIDNININGNVVTGIEDDVFIPFSIYPNPSSGLVHLESNQTINVKSVSVIDILGNIIATEKMLISNNHLQIDLRNQSKGIYYINYQTDNRVITEKVIIR